MNWPPWFCLAIIDLPALGSDPDPVRGFRPQRTWPMLNKRNYHVRLDDHFYSVPWALANEVVEARLTATTVEIFALHRRVASHARSYEVGGYTTVREHMPVNHRWWADKDPEQMVASASKIGPCTATMARRILESNFHRDAAWKSASGLLSLSHRYGADELEHACEKALSLNCRSYKSVERMLKLGIGRDDGEGGADAPAPIDHDNVRGPQYYD